jgi:hypothetical protein
VAPNRFFIWTLGARVAAEFSPPQAFENAELTDVRYFAGIAAELDRLRPGRGITFLLTWHLDTFDERFRDAVVILVGDEKYQVPAYAGSVRAIFKTGGRTPNPIGATMRLAPAVAWRVALRDARNRLLAARRRARSTATPAFEIPMGYFGLADVPFVEFSQRSTDLFFAGSIETGAGFTLRPRLAARRQMGAALEQARLRLPTVSVRYSGSGPFANPGAMLGPAAYSSGLMNAKIALCPRGNFDETFRLGEAARSGCVAITEPLPERWYYRDAPVVQLARWSELPSALEALLADPAGLTARAAQTRRWWVQTLSEAAVARFIAASLDETAR